MIAVLPMRLAQPFLVRSTYLRFMHLILGGLLALPYLAVAQVGAILLGVRPGQDPSSPAVALQALFVITAASATGLVPAVRRWEGFAASELLRGPMSGVAVRNARSWSTRWRTACWFVLHLGLGTLIGFLTLVVPPLIVVLLVTPLLTRPLVNFPDTTFFTVLGVGQPWSPLVGLALVVAGLLLVAGSGELLARIAPPMLGPSARERLIAAERQVEQLSERNRIASELHDSVGHALSVVTLQAGAAARAIDKNATGAREALNAIEESARTALNELDHALGLLRGHTEHRTPAPRTLDDLGPLLHSTDLAGLTVHTEINGALGDLPSRISGEAYRAVREGLTNALRHADDQRTATLRITVTLGSLDISLSNPCDPPATHRTGGQGLRGLHERIPALGGEIEAAQVGEEWTLRVRFPLTS